MTKSTYDFTNFAALLEKADISVDEAAKLFKVSRVTIYSWCNGHAPNQKLILETAERLIKMITRAITAEDLPVINSTRDDKHAKITEVLRKHLTP